MKSIVCARNREQLLFLGLRDSVNNKSVVHNDTGTMCADLLATDDVELQVNEIEIKVLHASGYTSGSTGHIIEYSVVIRY